MRFREFVRVVKFVSRTYKFVLDIDSKICGLEYIVQDVWKRRKCGGFIEY